ncbi:DUF804 domain membrane protein [Pseudohyphozyma bogoriensis]|nr:DUF804 domain membrane protein [Pseudohyphozyma bogoriensis]
MLGSPDSPPQIAVAVGVVVGLLASFVQSLGTSRCTKTQTNPRAAAALLTRLPTPSNHAGLTIQRKSHLQNEALPSSLRKRDFQRPLWIVGFTVFICSNLLGTIFQIGALPIVVLAPLGAVSLLYNAFFARVILGDEFTIHLVVGTILIAGGAVLIGIFGAFIIWMSLLSFGLVAALVLSHVTEWAFERRLSKFGSPSTPKVTRRTSSLWSGSSKKKAAPLAHSSPVPQYGAFENTSTSARTGVEQTPTLHSRNTPAIGSEEPNATKRVVIEDEEVAGEPADPKHGLSAAAIERTRLILGVAYGAASGTLSGLCLLFAKTGIELLILTAVGQNQFGHYQAWMIVLVLVICALLQLFYLNRALRLVGPTLICPLAFCFYNLSSMISGLIYYDQLDDLTNLQISLVTLGTVILLTGVWVVSLRTEAKPKEHAGAYGAGPVTEEPESDGESSDGSTGEQETVEWIPRGLTIGLGASSPGFAPRPAGHRRHTRTATLPTSTAFPSLHLEDHDRPLIGAPGHPAAEFDSAAGDLALHHRKSRGYSLSGALYTGVGRRSESGSAPSSPMQAEDAATPNPLLRSPRKNRTSRG